MEILDGEIELQCKKCGEKYELAYNVKVSYPGMTFQTRVGITHMEEYAMKIARNKGRYQILGFVCNKCNYKQHWEL